MEAKRKKGTGTIIEKNGKYRAELQYVDPYTQKVTKLRGGLRSRKSDADIDLRELRERRDRILEASCPNVEAVTISEYYVNIFLPFKKTQLKEGNSYSRFESTVYNHIIPAFGMKRLIDVTSKDINSLLASKHEEGLSHSSVKKIHDGFSSMFTFAVKKGDLRPQENPMNGVSMIREDKFKPSTQHYLTPQEVSALAEAISTKTYLGTYLYKYGNVFLFMLNSGLREGEVCALLKTDFDFDKRVVKVNKNLNQVRERQTDGSYKYTLKVTSPKNRNSIRYVPLNKEAIKYAKAVMAEFDETDKFIYGIHGEWTRPGILIKQFQRILERAGIEKMGLHSLRHTFVSMLFEHDVDIHTIASIIGDTVTTVEKTYLHLYKERKMRAVNTTNVVAAADQAKGETTIE